MIHATRKFDDRQVDFATGRKISPPMSARKVCNCCGQRIVKGWIMNNGDLVGEDCENIIRRAVGKSVDDFSVALKRSMGLSLKPAMKAYLHQAVCI